jgi:hypothetical protein
VRRISRCSAGGNGHRHEFRAFARRRRSGFLQMGLSVIEGLIGELEGFEDCT